jgi:hypothetical protein
MQSSVKYVNRLEDLPREAHFVIMKQSSYYTPGDERSRTNPGHGYPASTEYYVSYVAYTDRKEWEAEIDRITRQHDSFRAFAVSPAKINTTVSVNVEA